MIIISNLPRDGKGECEDEKISSWTTSRSVGPYEAALLRANWLPPRYVVTFLILIYSKVTYCDLHTEFSIFLFQLCIALSISLFPRSMAVAARNDACAPTAAPKANRHAIGARHALINSAPVPWPFCLLPCLDPTRRLSYPVGQASRRTINFDPPRSISMMKMIPSISYPHHSFAFPPSFLINPPLVSPFLQFFLALLHLASPHPAPDSHHKRSRSTLCLPVTVENIL